ncbi:MAG: alpha/beta hydrolase fold domain-containing protein, partial [Myxococcales bacterium]|nr:alpha/beta hydrolase fold domain-containing protein [Myxococcales bacterium]
MSDKQPRRAGLEKIRRKTGGGLALDRPIGEQRAAFAKLMALTEVGMPDHLCEPRFLGGMDCLRLEVPLPREGGDSDDSDDADGVGSSESAGPSGATILYIHGGGYSLGSPVTHRPLAARIARRCGAPIWLPRYRRAPEHPCPAGLEDVHRSYLELRQSLRQRGQDGPVFLAGDSAGGGMALALAMTLRDQRGGEALSPAGLVLLSPWTDLTMSG